MAIVNSSPNMVLPIPAVGQESGPQWASDLNASLTIIDGHNHSPGLGVAINPSGLDINSDLSFQANNVTNARSVRLSQNVSPIAAVSPDLACIYAAPNGGTGLYDLYYNDGAGNQIPITQNGGVAGSPGSISGLVSPASASYVALAETFVWQSDVSTPANTDTGYIILRNNSANSKGLTLSPPLAMGADYSVVLPALPIGSSKILVMDVSGNIFASIVADNSTLQLSSTTLSVANGGITSTQLAANSVITSKIPDGAVTLPKLAPMGLTFDGSDPGLGGLSRSANNSGSYAGSPITLATTVLTTGGNPVMIRCDGDPTNPTDLTVPASVTINLVWRRDGTVIARSNYINNDAVNDQLLPPSMFSAIDSGTSGSPGCPAGTHSYTLEVNQGLRWHNLILSAVEMR